jgi:nucleoside-diphosphate-sugar epimerase
MARVLVTGASGFIGLQLVEALLARGDDVRCLVQSTSDVEPLQRLGVELIEGDVTVCEALPAAVSGVDTVYHLAGLTTATGMAAYRQVNETGVQNVVDACAKRGTPPVMVLVSSLSAAGPMIDPQRLRIETDASQPISRYGKSKRLGELAAESRAAEVPITIVRPPIVLGPGDKTGAKLFRSIRLFRSFVVVGLGHRLSVVYVGDLAAALMAAADRGERLTGGGDSAENSTTGRGYYFVAAEHPTFAELARIVARSLDRPKAWAIPLPGATLWIIGSIGELIGRATGRARYLNLDRAKEVNAGHWTCSAEKAHQQLGFTPGSPLAQRIEQTVQWYREHGWL